MLDKIQNTASEALAQSQSLDRIKEIDSSSRNIEEQEDYFVDECEISSDALSKYQHEQDVKRFSDILIQTDEAQATDLVLKQAFDGTISIDNDDFLAELLSSDEFLNDII